jgi:hypothetical protein
MLTRSRVVAVTAAGLVAIAVLSLLLAVRDARRAQSETLELSRMKTVQVIVGSALSDYYQTNGSYPKMLEEIPAGLLHWGGEASSPADLKLFRYISTSNTFTLTWNLGTNYQLFVGGRAARPYWNEQEFNAALRQH